MSTTTTTPKTTDDHEGADEVLPIVYGCTPCDPELVLRTPADLCAACRLQFHQGIALEDMDPGVVPAPVTPVADDEEDEDG